MFKDVFVLKKSSWHARLMKYIWNYSYRDFTHMCPYFWLTVANIPLFLIVFPFKTIIGKLLGFIRDAFIAIGEIHREKVNKREQSWFGEQIKRMEDKAYFLEVAKANPFRRDASAKWKSFADKISWSQPKLWMELHNKITELAQQSFRENITQPVPIPKLVYVDVELDKERQAAKKARMIARKKAIAQASNAIKFIAKIIGYIILGIVTLFILYWCRKGVIGLSNIPHKEYIKAFSEIGIVTGTLAGAFITIAGLMAGVTWLFDNIELPDVKLKTPKTPRWMKVTNKAILKPIGHFISFVCSRVWMFIKYIGIGIFTAIEFLIQMIKANCPAVRWID